MGTGRRRVPRPAVAPHTGVRFSWDSGIDAWQREPDDEGTIWTRAMADELWNGAISPLMYSWRAGLWQRAQREHAAGSFELSPLADARMWKFHRGEAYYNCRVQQILVEVGCPPPFRPGLVDKLPPAWREESVAAGFDKRGYARKYLKLQLGGPTERFRAWLGVYDRAVDERFEEMSGLDDDQLARLSDSKLLRYIDRCIDLEYATYGPFWVAWFIYSRDILSVLAGMVMTWYDGDNPNALMELMTGSPTPTKTIEENHDLWRLAEQIHRSETLSRLFTQYEGADFFDALGDDHEGRTFAERYARFVDRHAHRGHADRDMYFPRRSEDPDIDYRILKGLLGAPDPEQREREVNARRNSVIDDVTANIRTKRLGRIKARAFRYVLDYVLTWFTVRDNQRYLADRATFTVKRAFLELNRRLLDRGQIDRTDDLYFLARDELFALFHRNQPADAVTRAKIAARRADFEEVRDGNRIPPLYLQNDAPIILDSTDEDSGTDLTGIGTSPGTITARARVVTGLHEIGRLEHGDVLVCNSTDPGWAAAFLTVSAVIAETGGMLAHFACLSREYGLPAVQLSGARARIPDGATVTINGTTGHVTIHDTVTVTAGEARA